MGVRQHGDYLSVNKTITIAKKDMQGKIINGFELKRPLGTGGMAEVWYAENEIGMKAAVKVMSERLSHDEQMQDRFLNEAKVMVKLDHPNIRKVYGFGNVEGRPAIIMEYLDGSDLKGRMKRGQCFTEAELEKWWNQLVDALNYTHSKDIVHRDIKPSNIFIDQRGDAKLLDFGIAKVADTTSGTQTGSTLGTRIYMSPEQVRDPKRVGPASDVYSLAVSYVHLLSGKAPYDSTTSSDFDIQVSIVSKPVDMSRVSYSWRAFLTPYLQKEPDQRPALRHFEVVEEAPQMEQPDRDEETVAENTGNGSDSVTSQETSVVTSPPYDKPSIEDHLSGSSSREDGTIAPTFIDTTEQKPKSKKGLWIGLGIAAAAIAALVAVLALPKEEKYDGPYAGYKKTDSGLYYQFFNQNTEAAQPQVGDVMEVAMNCYVNDTLCVLEDGLFKQQLKASMFSGDLFEGMAMMHKGDSASFIVNIDSIFRYHFEQPSLPSLYTSTDVMRYGVRLDDFYPESEYAVRLGAKIKKDTEARIEKMKLDYPDETATAAQQLAEYMAKNKVAVDPTESGLYYVMTKEGNGEKPKAGQMVQVHYTGKLLDGTVFDSSVERGEPINIPISVGQVIPGWDEGIMMMSKGEKGVLYIPYYLAYGDRQAGDISPFSNLVFEVELIDFWDN